MKHETLSRYILEEAYEAVEAIAEKDWDSLSGELGDVLLQVLLHSKIAEKSGHFTLEEVFQKLEDKLIRRHPHIFEKAKKLSQSAIEEQWERIKKSEKENQTPKPWKKLLSKHSPATNQALEVGKKAEKIHFDWSTPEEAFAQLESEILEIKESLSEDKKTGDYTHTKEEIGDVYFGLAQLCRHLGFDPEETAFQGNLKFCQRMEKMEEISGDKKLSTFNQDELEELWKKVKKLP